MLEVLAAGAWPVLLLLTAQVTAGARWQCEPCPPEKLTNCDPVPDTCLEVTRYASCDCCPVCALTLGEPCGVKTARCARGLTCQPLPGERKPLRSLIFGKGVCIQNSAKADATDNMDTPAEELIENSRRPASSLQDRSMADGRTEIEITNNNSKEPCRRELYRVLDNLAKIEESTGERVYRFYLPNCNRNGFYHPKQCESALDGGPRLCWCVYPWNGKRIPGSPESRVDPDCDLYVNAQN
ncbi:insulin-like growth factor-binding protein 1 [Saimiri boliviensis]|uniref:Insulin-like growth factor-binding protein 1 n=1 Tax=Saimiri boliviensis boliviensis TaxID=39432 RepID=A0A2K6SIH9_SAIBB|nr:insulin-like growth factor-binding protein 1 [Saimiri boliviensis boliviensis]